MSIFAQPVTSQQIFDWRYRTDPFRLHEVARWPRHITARTNCFFRVKYTNLNAFSPLRWFIHWDSADVQPSDAVDGYVDLVPIGENHLLGVSDVDPQGFEISVEVQSFEVLPLTANPGVQVVVTIENTLTSTTFTVTKNYDWLSAEEYVVPLSTADSAFSATSEIASPGWNFNLNTLYAQGVGSCYLFPGSSPVLEDFANFNGVDSYIQLDGFTNFLVNRWQWSADLYIRRLAQTLVMVNGSVSSVLTGVGSTTVFFQSLAVPHLGSIPLETWVNVKLSRGWAPGPSNVIRYSLDDVLINSITGGNPSAVFNRLGGNRPTTPTQWGDFNMRNLVVLTGFEDAPIVRLDMPLQINACDDSPSALNGETFNMELPSCP